jgi:hypothetical protein
MPLARPPDRGPGEHSGAVRDRGPASALARRLPARDEGWQKAYYGENRPKVLRFAESKGARTGVFVPIASPISPTRARTPHRSDGI